MEKDNEKLKFIDTHAHYYHSRFKRNLNDLMTQMEDDLEYIINLGTNTKSNINTMNLIKKYNYLYGMVGFFPSDVLELENKDILELLKKQLTNKKIVGIGEIGIDYYHNTPEHDLPHYRKNAPTSKPLRRWWVEFRTVLRLLIS